MMAARGGHGGRNSVGGRQGVPFADWVGASWRERSDGRMAGQRQTGRRQAGSGMARSRARASLNWVFQGPRFGRCKVRRRAERVSRPAREKKRRRRVLVVTSCSPRPMRVVQPARLWAMTPYRVLDLGVAAVVSLQFQGIPIAVGDKAVIAVAGEEGQLGTGRGLHPTDDEPHRRGVGLTLEGGVASLRHVGGAVQPVGYGRPVRLGYGLDDIAQAGVLADGAGVADIHFTADRD